MERFREIERKDPKNKGIYVIKRTLETDIPTHDIFNLKTPIKRDEPEENKHDYEMGVRTERVGKVAPPPPPPPTFSKGVAEALGKRAWQIAKLKDDEDRFFKMRLKIINFYV